MKIDESASVSVRKIELVGKQFFVCAFSIIKTKEGENVERRENSFRKALKEINSLEIKRASELK
jgi:hypothetical protein